MVLRIQVKGLFFSSLGFHFQTWEINDFDQLFFFYLCLAKTNVYDWLSPIIYTIYLPIIVLKMEVITKAMKKPYDGLTLVEWIFKAIPLTQSTCDITKIIFHSIVWYYKDYFEPTKTTLCIAPKIFLIQGSNFDY